MPHQTAEECRAGLLELFVVTAPSWKAFVNSLRVAMLDHHVR